MGMGAMFEHIQALPSAKGEASRDKRHRETGLRQAGADVRSHIVRSLGDVAIILIVLGDEALEKIAYV